MNICESEILKFPFVLIGSASKYGIFSVNSAFVFPVF